MLTVTDIKQYAYCKRIIYFTYVAPVRKGITRKMDFGKEAHDILDSLESRRTLRRYGLEEGERHFHHKLVSNRLGFSGRLDLHLVSPKGIFPVEFKNTERGSFLNHKYQLTAYSLLLEEFYKRPVRQGFIYLIPQGRVLEVLITTNMRNYVKDILWEIRELIREEKFPSMAEKKRKCIDCEYRNFCGDVI
ncbi:MAG: CRISPR-associated protein Cas4 [Desulfitobacterium hafniense]|nr:CRISPR-associated protein Cas4 [Desulfitobacterium hafniense]